VNCIHISLSAELFTERCPLSILSELLFASYEAAYRIIPCRKPHTTGRNLILGASIDIVTAVLGKASVRKLSRIPLSNDTVCYQIGGFKGAAI
jgi:hypothetical protein